MADYPSKKRYDAENTKKYTFKFNKNTEPELMAWLESRDNMAGAVKALIRAEIARTGYKMPEADD